MAEPIGPDEVVARKAAQLPSGIIEAFNEIIARTFDGKSSIVYQDELVEDIMTRGIVTSRQEIWDRHLLDVEPVYRAAGWQVTYEKPAFNENGRAFFTFTRP